MTPERAKELLPVIQAFAEGKSIQFRNQFTDWINNNIPTWSDNKEYRIKPEHKLRPWKPEEVPVGALIRYKNTGHADVFQIIGRSQLDNNAVAYTIVHNAYPWLGANKMLMELEHSLDHGKTWFPCGIVEE